MSVPRPPRIGVLMEFPTALGGERSLLAVAEALREEFEFVILAPPGGSLASELHGTTVQLQELAFRDSQGNRRPDAELLPELQALLQQERCSLLHANSLTLARFAGRYRDAFSVPITGHLRDIMRISAKAAHDLSQLNRLIAVSQATADCYRAQGVPPERMSVIHNGIDAEVYRRPPQFALRQELHLPEDCRLAVVIGQIGLRKGHDVLFQALERILHEVENWHFLILGERYSGKQESREFITQLEAAVERNGLLEQVHWLGYMNDVPSVLAQADLLIHPARQEPFGRVLLEAAAAGVAIVATDVGGTSEMLRHQESAWLVPPSDSQALSEACRILLTDANLRQQLGQQAAQRIRQQFPVTQAAQALAKIWRDCLADNSPRGPATT